MRRTLVAGGLLAVLALLLVDHAGHEVASAAVLGAALGAVLGLVPDRAPGWRAGGFLAGFALTWVMYAVRAQFLPDIPLGRGIAAFLLLALVTGVSLVSFGRMPLWAGLLGAAAMVGGYETAFSADPTAFLTESPAAATAVLVTAVLGFFVTVGIGELSLDREEGPPSEILLPSGRHKTLELPTQTARAESGIDIVRTTPEGETR